MGRYSVALRPTADGPVRVTLMNARFKDLADNYNTRADDEVVLDLTPPVVTLLILHPPIGNLTAARFLVFASEELAAINTSSVSVQNGQATTLTVVNTTAGRWAGQVWPHARNVQWRVWA